MPYRSRAERERENWYSLSELVEHVKAVDGCDAQEAEKQCRSAFADGALKLKWEPSIVSPWVKPGEINPWLAGKPFHGDRNWLAVKIDWDTGIVLDDFDMPEDGAPIERCLFVEKQSAQGAWRPVAPARTGGGKPARQRPGPKPGSIKRYEKADRALFPEIMQLREQGMSLTEATNKLADENKLKGRGSSTSRARRLALLYSTECSTAPISSN
jgi:hypothetical protein